MLALDNDVLIKLAAFELLTPSVRLLQTRFGALAVLPTAHYVVRKRSAVLGLVQLNREWPKFAVLSAAPDMTNLDRLSQVFQIDDGEALLIAAACAESDLILATGDKRCLTALAADPALRDVVARIAGRVLSFEQIIVALLDSEHAPLTCSNLCRLPVIDHAVHAVTGGTRKTPDELRLGFASYIRDLQATGIVLHPDL